MFFSLIKWFRPMYVDRMFLLVIGNLTNVGLAVYGLIERPTDFASFVLAIFITNLMLYTSFYIIMKLRHGEKILGQPLLYIGLSTACWAAAMYFFINKAITWRVWQLCSMHLIFSHINHNLLFVRNELLNRGISIKSVLYSASTIITIYGISCRPQVYSSLSWYVGSTFFVCIHHLIYSSSLDRSSLLWMTTLPTLPAKGFPFSELHASLSERWRRDAYIFSACG